MTTIYEDLDLPSTDTPVPAEVRIRLAGAQGRPVLGKTVSTNKTIIGESVLRTGQGINSAGLWEMDLWPNADILPAGTTWQISRKVGCQVAVSYITVPVTGGPYEAFTREDDPLGTITPTALAAHASDPSLHGGGIEVGFDWITAAVTVTGTGGGLTAAAVPGIVVPVPDLARPVYLLGHVPATQPTGGPAEASWGIWKSTNLGAFAALDVAAPAGLNTATARTVELFARLPPFSAGDYVIGASGVGGNLTARAAASALAWASLRAVAA